MTHVHTFSAVAIDLARHQAPPPPSAGEAQQELPAKALTGLIVYLLTQEYQVFLFNAADPIRVDIAGRSEDVPLEGLFVLPRIQDVIDGKPRCQREYPLLFAAGDTLWHSDNGPLQEWLASRGAFCCGLERRAATPHEGLSYQHIHGLDELKAWLDPTTLLLDAVIQGLRARARHPQRQLPRVLGIGGPPFSDYAAFSALLAEHLGQADMGLVEAISLDPILPQALRADPPTTATTWQDTAAGKSFLEHVLVPFQAGKDVFLRQPPPALEALADVFPLFLSAAESTLLLYGEQVLTSPLREHLDVALLFHVDAEETARRYFQLPSPSQQNTEPLRTADRQTADLTKQYLQREGRYYQRYLQRHRVKERADGMVRANRPRKTLHWR